MNLRCYCCGEPVKTGAFALATMLGVSDAVDRVFIVDPDHLERLDDSVQSLMVVKVPQD